MNLLETDKSIERYLGAVESGIAMSDAQAHKKREEQAADLLTHLDHAEGHLDEIGRQEALLLRTALDELRVQFALGKMEGAEKFSAIEKKIDHGFHQVKEAMARAKKITSDDIHTIEENFHKAWQALKLELNLLDIRIDLAEEKTSKRISEATDEAIKDIKMIGHYAKESADQMNDKFHAWAKNTKESLSNRGQKILDHLIDYYSKF